MNKTYEEIVAKYSAKDFEALNETTEELCNKGVAKGCYQHYDMLVDVLNVLSIFVRDVKERK